MWVSNQSKLFDKVICFSAPGGHMSWVAALIGFTFNRWGLEDMIRPDGSAHNVKDMLPHFSRTELPFTIDNYNRYLEDNFGYNGNPTIYHDGFSNAQDARQWVRVMGEYGSMRTDTLLVPIVACDVQEAMYMLLNVGSKGADNELSFLEKLTGVTDDGSKTFDDLAYEMSFHVMRPWSIWSGMHVYGQGDTYTMADILRGAVFPIEDAAKRNYMHIISRQYAKLQQPNWKLSLDLAFREITTWKRPETLTAAVLTHLMARRRFNRRIPISWDWNQSLRVDLLEESETQFHDFGEMETEIYRIANRLTTE